MSNARTLASYASSFPSFRNRIINGDLSNPINQRGAASTTASTGYTYDRWYYDGSTATPYLYQGIEDKNVNNGTYVISWVGAGINAAWKVSTDTTANNGPDATTGFTSVSNGGTFTVNEGTEYSKHLWIRFDGTLANLDKVMVEEGTVATPFEHRPYGTELALCQRYCYALRGQGGYTPFGFGYWTSDTGIYAHITYPVTMRSSPTVTFSDANLFYVDNGTTPSAIGADQVGKFGSTIGLTSSSSGVNGWGTRILADSNNTAYIIFSAEL